MRPTLHLTLISLLVGTPAVQAQSAIVVPEILKAVDQYPRRLQSARAEGVAVVTMTKALFQFTRDKGTPQTTRQPVVWAFKGDKRYRRTVERFDPKKSKATYRLITRTRTELFDGRHQYILVASQYTGQKNEIVQGTLFAHPMTSVPILSIGYKVFGQWVCDILRDTECRLDGTEHHPDFGTLYRFSVEKKSGLLSRISNHGDTAEQVRFWLAPKYGFLAVRSESEVKSAARAVHQRLVLRMVRAERRGSIWFPVEGLREWYSIAGSKEALLSQDRLIVNRFELNNVPDSLFRPNLKTGYYIRDNATSKQWKIGPNGERIYIQGRRQPISVLPGGWLFVASMTSLLALAMGAFLRWRRRRYAS